MTRTIEIRIDRGTTAETEGTGEIAAAAGKGKGEEEKEKGKTAATVTQGTAGMSIVLRDTDLDRGRTRARALRGEEAEGTAVDPAMSGIGAETEIRTDPTGAEREGRRVTTV